MDGERGAPSREGWERARAESWKEMQPPQTASLERLKELAGEGDAVAACDLGILYMLGEHGAEKNTEESAKWFRQSAEGHDERGATNYAILLAKGEGVPKDPVESMRWYRIAAESRVEGKIGAKYQLRVAA